MSIFKTIKELPKSSRLMIMIMLAVGFIAGWIYRPSGLYFLNDDFIYIAQSPNLKYLYGTAFRPIADLSLLIDFSLWGKNAWGYHFTNFLIHTLCTVLVYIFCKRLIGLSGLKKGNNVALISGFCFWIYPFHTESVFWIIGRGGSLITLCFLGALLFLLKPKTNIIDWGLTSLCFMIGLLVYESIWVLPFSILVLLLLKRKSGFTITTIDKAGITLIFSIFIFSFILRKIFIGSFVGSPYVNHPNFSITPFSIIYKYCTGIARSIMFPLHQNILFLAGSAIAFALFVGVLIYLWKQKELRKVLLFFISLFLLSLTPVALLGVNTNHSESERFLYLPSVFISIFIGIAIAYSRFSGSYKVIAISLYSVFSLTFLFKSGEAYRIASQWNKKSIERLQRHEMGVFNRIDVFNLPAQFKGGLMFRLGFPEALDWMVPGIKYDTIVIHTRAQLQDPIIMAEDAIQIATTEVQGNTKNLSIQWNSNSLTPLSPALIY